MVYCKHADNTNIANKEERFNVAMPHCNYETTDQNLHYKHNVYSKHTPENERPFQCP